MAEAVEIEDSQDASPKDPYQDVQYDSQWKAVEAARLEAESKTAATDSKSPLPSSPSVGGAPEITPQNEKKQWSVLINMVLKKKDAITRPALKCFKWYYMLFFWCPQPARTKTTSLPHILFSDHTGFPHEEGYSRCPPET